jgi:N-acetylmuramoyl-L-alanine amidase
MKRLTGLFAALVISSACAGAVVRPSPVATTTTSDKVVTTLPASDSAPPSTTSTAPGPPVAWIAPSGVPMPITAAKGGSVEVLTPCGDQVVITEGTPVYEVEVVIDPGHGGPIDTGAVGENGLGEKDINLQVSLAIHDLLAERGIPSLLTRVGDYPIPIRTRAAYSDLVDARAMVSIHHNAPLASASAIPGVEIFVQSNTPDSARLGGLIYEQTMSTLSEFDVDWVRAPDAGVMTVINSEGEDAYGMVRRPEAPSALVELGYIANPAEARLYTNPAYVPAVASAVAGAIEVFVTSDQAGSPLVEGRDFDPAAGVGQDQCIEPDLDQSLYPDVVDVSVGRNAASFDFEVTVSSPYDSPNRYADAWRVIGEDGQIYGVRELTHHHANEQPFTRSLEGLDIPGAVDSVTVQARDLVYGWGGRTVEVTLP